MPAEPVPVVCVPAEGTFGAAVNAAGRAAGRAPVVVLEPGVAPPAADALERLRAAAAETTVATASALRHGLHVPDGVTPEQAAERAQRLRPRIADPVPGAVLLTRAALDLAGPLDEDERFPAAILAEFGERCLARGLSHVLADDVLVPGTPAPMTDAEAAALAERFPHRAVAARAFAAAGEPVERALAAVRVGAAPLTVTIDGRALGPYRAGTQVHLLELVAALARTGRAALRVVVAHDLAPDAAALFAREPAISTISYEEAANGSPEPTEVVHRPSQVFTPDDLALLVPLGERLVVTHQDLIAYRSPAYHRHAEDWARLRTTTRLALGSADRVAFFSRHALEDALAEDLVEPARAAVVPIGVDHHVAAAAEPAAPEGFDPAVPYLLCLGADLPHKNHGFAVALLDALRSRGWAGRLVLAGPRADDREPLAHEHVTELGSVSEAEKAFLLANAAAVAYPTLYEGFGLVPFEAGAAGVPCAFAPVASLAEVLPRELAVLVPWDAEASAAALRPLLEPGGARDEHVAGLREAARPYTWDGAAERLLGLYADAVRSPVAEARHGPRERLRIQDELVVEAAARREEWERFQAFRDELGADALGLVGPGGVLDAADRRALLALASRPAVKRPLMGAVRAAYAAGLRLRRR